RETVYSYGEYLRRYVDQVKQRGATPILFSLTPRLAYIDRDSTRIARVDSTFGLWAREIAAETGVPFVDLNDITATKFERFGKEKTKTMFYLDRIHTSALGARINAASAAEGIATLEGCQLRDYLLPPPVDTVTGSSRKGNNPVVFIIGDSTVKVDSTGTDTMWGWGDMFADHLDTSRISVENHAKAGRSARTFLEEGRWDKIYDALQPGDFVLIQFGHNDGGDIATGKARGELPGTDGRSKVFRMEKSGDYRVVYTYGWYLRKFIDDAREKGAIPVIISPAPRNRWTDGKIESLESTFAGWARDVAARSKTDFVDLNAISGHKLEKMGIDSAAEFFKNDHTHSSLRGARLNASSVAEGIEAGGGKLSGYLRPRPMEYDMM
ncbi:MAG: rhamnogalacturonan acetylesterase, partial [Duncaniella sp.]|nr:rhamnogalacturonan acetylesterase [Duncaniella sp.]